MLLWLSCRFVVQVQFLPLSTCSRVLNECACALVISSYWGPPPLFSIFFNLVVVIGSAFSFIFIVFSCYCFLRSLYFPLILFCCYCFIHFSPESLQYSIFTCDLLIILVVSPKFRSSNKKKINLKATRKPLWWHETCLSPYSQLLSDFSELNWKLLQTLVGLV